LLIYNWTKNHQHSEIPWFGADIFILDWKRLSFQLLRSLTKNLQVDQNILE